MENHFRSEEIVICLIIFSAGDTVDVVKFARKMRRFNKKCNLENVNVTYLAWDCIDITSKQCLDK